MLNLSIAEVLDAGRSHITGYIVIERLKTRDKIELFYRLCSPLLSSVKMRLRKKFKVIVNNLSEVNEFRNSLAHANWLTMDSGGYVRTKVRTATEDGSVTFRRSKITVRKIRQMRLEVESLAQKLPFLFDELTGGSS